MFCTTCGSQIREGQNFCVQCGTPAKRYDTPAAAQPAPPAPPQPQAPPPPPPAAAAISNSGENDEAGVVEDAAPVDHAGACPWCGAPYRRGETACTRCGAALALPQEVSQSGWAQLPGRKDMAKIQFGNSFCQIEGAYVPVADMKLAPEDSVYFTHHVLLWKDPQVNITTMSMRGGWKRLFAGLPLIMTQAQGPGHIAFSKDNPGELIALPLQPGQVVDVREHMFLADTSNVQYGWYTNHIWLQTGSGNDRETHYPIGMNMDQFGAQQTPGLLLLHAGGNVFVRSMGPGESILIKPT